MTSPFEWFGFRNPGSLGFSMLQFFVGYDAGRLSCCHSDSFQRFKYSQRFGK